jgi:hypothetical protein
MINADKSLSKSFERLFVVNPDLSGTPFGALEDVAKEYGAKFANLGWTLKKETYYYQDDPNDNCRNSLLITKP